MEPLGGMDVEEVPIDIEERIGRLQLEYDRNAQAIQDLNLLIEELENEQTCRPRSFYRGEVKSIERNMRCAFCEAIGSHYSDSCWEVATARERRQLLADKKKCELCLEIICCGGKLCRKYGQPCFHCHRTEHYSALCSLPEESPIIMQRLQRARDAKEHHRRRAEELEHEINELGRALP